MAKQIVFNNDARELLRKVTKTNKALYHTFITTYGIARNLHSGIVQSEVTMDDLFDYTANTRTAPTTIDRNGHLKSDHRGENAK